MYTITDSLFWGTFCSLCATVKHYIAYKESFIIRRFVNPDWINTETISFLNAERIFYKVFYKAGIITIQSLCLPVLLTLSATRQINFCMTLDKVWEQKTKNVSAKVKICSNVNHLQRTATESGQMYWYWLPVLFVVRWSYLLHILNIWLQVFCPSVATSVPTVFDNK